MSQDQYQDMIDDQERIRLLEREQRRLAARLEAIEALLGLDR